MSWATLQGEQYVRLGPGASETVAPYVGVPADEIDELLLDLGLWPEQIQPTPIRGWDGRLIRGDPILLAATGTGLTFATRHPDGQVTVPWGQVRTIQVVGRLRVGA